MANLSKGESMFIKKLLSRPKDAKKKEVELLALQAAQFAGFTQATALLKRLTIRASDIEKSDFKLTDDTIRPFEHYPVKLAKVLTFEHLAEGRAKGIFSFQLPKLRVHIGISLQREIFLVRRERDHDGFEQITEFDRWRPIQAGIALYFSGDAAYATKVSQPIGPSVMEGDTDIVTEFIAE